MQARKCLWGLLPLYVLLSLYGGCTQEQKSAEIIRPVHYQVVEPTGGPNLRSFKGISITDVEAEPQMEVSGTLSRLYVKRGDLVETEMLIAELDPEDYLFQVRLAELRLAEAQAKTQKASSEYEQTRKLYDDGFISLSELNSIFAVYDSTKKAATLSELQLETARKNLQLTQLRSSLNGRVTDLYFQEGNYVAAGDSIMKIVNDSKPEVACGIPDIGRLNIHEGTKAIVKFDSLPGQQFAGAVTFIGSDSLKLKPDQNLVITLIQTNPKIDPGMSAELIFSLSGGSNERFLVPAAAVNQDPQGKFVYIAVPQDKNLAVVQRKPVRIGHLISGKLEIVEGLQDGDLIITAGLSQIEEGMKVNLLHKVGY
jgi:RND family efflux transporter MFP subunit